MSDIPENKHITYQAQYRRCGKTCATCSQGLGHGPYLYAYWREGKRMRSKSMGKILKIDTVQAYFRQVYRVVEQSQSQWDALKLRLLQEVIVDHRLTQEQLKLILLDCKEHISQRKRKLSSVASNREAAHLPMSAIAV